MSLASLFRQAPGRPLAALFFALSLLPASAQPGDGPPMSGAEFDAYTRGKTLYFGQAGTPYGVERYGEDRAVTWSFLDGRCKEGRWREAEDGQICFRYETEEREHCWQFFRAPGGGLTARFGADPDLVPLYEAREGEEPMLCLGPEIGV